MTFKELRQISGMTQKEFAEYFEIPKRTIESWDEGARKCPEYLLNLMYYKLVKEGKYREMVKCDRCGYECRNPYILVAPKWRCPYCDGWELKKPIKVDTTHSRELYERTKKNIAESRKKHEEETYQTVCQSCGTSVMCLDKVKEHLVQCPICKAELKTK